jgi:hypothetical protein
MITVVSGLPRSGTSLMMQMLQAGGLDILTDNVRSADEHNPRGYLEYEAVKRTGEDAAWLDFAEGKAVKIVYLLLKALPANRKYRVILMRRVIEEVIASQEAMLDKRQNKGAQLPGPQLARILSAQLDEVVQWVKQQLHFELLSVSYNELLKDPAAQADRVSDYCGGLDVSRMIEAIVPDLYRRRT